MKNSFLILVLLIFYSVVGLKAQTTNKSILEGYKVYASQEDADKAEEYLLLNIDSNRVFYWTETRLDKISLEISEGSIQENSFALKFPHSEAVYRLHFLDHRYKMVCQNPDGSSQEFTIPQRCILSLDKYTFEGPGAYWENIYLLHYNQVQKILYKSSQRTSRVELESKLLWEPGDVLTPAQASKLKPFKPSLNVFGANFPNESRVYVLDIHLYEGKIKVINPDGSEQIFIREW